MTSPNPFVRDLAVQKPGIIGARWWNQALREGSSLHGRRSSLKTAAWVGLGVLGLGAITIWGASSSRTSGNDDPEVREEKKRAVDLQRDYGWNFGAVTETVAFDVQYTQTYARDALKTLERDLSPSNPKHTPHAIPTLLQSPEALPRLTLPDGDTTRVQPLAAALRPIYTPSMEVAARRGAALGALLAACDTPVLTIVDLPGPEAVAFAAGASKWLDPIFLFDNWPHPRGVVPAHQTLAAAVYYQPIFAKSRDARPITAPPMAVLDRARLAYYGDADNQFDNRYFAKVPSPAALGVKRVLYVTPTSVDLPEKDDLNGPFAEWAGSGSEVRALAADAFTINPQGGTEYIFGGGDGSAFYSSYKWKPGPTVAAPSVAANEKAASYVPTRRAGASSVNIGLVPVVVAVGTGALLGARLNRSGSWNRVSSSGGWGGG